MNKLLISKENGIIAILNFGIEVQSAQINTVRKVAGFIKGAVQGGLDRIIPISAGIGVANDFAAAFRHSISTAIPTPIPIMIDWSQLLMTPIALSLLAPELKRAGVAVLPFTMQYSVRNKISW